MNILNGGRFWINGEEILQNKTITQDVKDAYSDFVEWMKDNNDQNYLIESKICMRSFLFDKNHKLIDLQPILVWKDLGKDLEVDIETLEDWLKPRILKYVKLVGESFQS